MLALNTSRAPFDNLKLRQAMQYAVDKSAQGTMQKIRAPVLGGFKQRRHRRAYAWALSKKEQTCRVREQTFPGSP